MSNTKSFLAEQADYVLNATIGEEGLPQQSSPPPAPRLIWPWAMRWPYVFGAQNFGSRILLRSTRGALDKQLFIKKVADLLAGHELPRVSPQASLKDVSRDFIEASGATAVVDGHDKLLEHCYRWRFEAHVGKVYNNIAEVKTEKHHDVHAKINR